MNNQRKKLLILTTFFPPVPSVASQRIISFVKYLSVEKYDIRVIAWSDQPADQPVIPGVSYKVTFLPNPKILKRATFSSHASLLFHKIKAFYNICISLAGVNEMSAWGKLAEKEIARTLKQWKPDLILATYPYPEALNVGCKSAERYGIPLIADLRDGLTNNSSYSSRVRIRLQSLEENMIRKAKVILAVSEPTMSYLKQKYEELKPEIYELRNGFDFKPGNSGSFNEVFTITFTGTFYGSNKPTQFFKAVQLLLENKRINRIRLRFIGVAKNFNVPKEIERFCEILPRLQYEDAVQLMKESDALLLIILKSEFKGIYSTKLFDYLGSMRPIIALIDKDDVAAELINESRAGFISGRDEVPSIMEAIVKAYELWERKEFPDFNPDLINRHHRRVLVQKLESILDSIPLNHE